MPSATVVTLILAPVLLFALWHVTAHSTPPVPGFLRNKRIILLIAHPDDESMFFSPTLQALTDPALQNHLKILCMSTGNSEGIGETRRQELEKAAVALGVRRREDVFVLDDERFKDGMDQDWKPDEVARVLASAFAPHLNTTQTSEEPQQDKEKDKRRSTGNKSKSSKQQQQDTQKQLPQSQTTGPQASIDVLITFDKQGISGHPNHKSLYHGATLFIKQIMKGHNGYACPVTLYTLPSINILRKYGFVLDTIPTLLAGVYGTMFANVRGTRGAGTREGADRVVFVNDLKRYWKAREAMTDGHQSQMVWFRWGWIALGRYMYVNDLRSEKVIPI
ncbi:N-acetylglucosaminyl-phosphatidylinositol de-N-acetylase [Exophiala dermatitidis]